MALLRPSRLYQKRSCVVLNDCGICADNVEISEASRLTRSASRCWSPLPDVLSGGDLAWPRAVLHSCLQGHIDRAGPRDRWDPRIHALRNWYRVASHAFVNERWRL